jgi:CheY-specific phosphatase CheX
LSVSFPGEEEIPDFSEETLDAIGEVADMIVGAVKESLEGSELHFQNISCPTIAMGPSYYFHYASGFTTVVITFEIDEIAVIHGPDRLFSVSISMMTHWQGAPAPVGMP